MKNPFIINHEESFWQKWIDDSWYKNVVICLLGEACKKVGALLKIYSKALQNRIGRFILIDASRKDLAYKKKSDKLSRYLLEKEVPSALLLVRITLFWPPL